MSASRQPLRADAEGYLCGGLTGARLTWVVPSIYSEMIRGWSRDPFHVHNDRLDMVEAVRAEAKEMLRMDGLPEAELDRVQFEEHEVRGRIDFMLARLP